MGWEKFSISVDMLIITVDDKRDDNGKQLPGKDLKIFLEKKKDGPYKGCFALPGRMAGPEESVEDAAYRVLKAKIGIGDVYIEQLYTWGDVRRNPERREISISYLALMPKERIGGKTDLEGGGWFIVEKKDLLEYTTNKSSMLSLEQENGLIKMGYGVTEYYERTGAINTSKTNIKQFPGTEEHLAFDHVEIMNLALERLKNKVEYTPVAFNLVHEEFTLPELQQVYETVLGKTLYKANFRKKIMPMVIMTDNKKTNVAHRPVQYYKFNPEYIDKNRL